MAKKSVKNVTVDSNKEVNAMNNNTNTTSNSTIQPVEVLSTEGAIILCNLMDEAQSEKNFKVLFSSKKYGCLLAKRANLLAFAKRVLPHKDDTEVKEALNELFRAKALFYRNLDRGCLIGMRQQEWTRARSLLLAAADAAKGTHEELTDKNIAFEGDTPVGGNGVGPRELE